MDFDKLLVVLAVLNLGVMSVAALHAGTRWSQRVQYICFYVGLANLAAVLVRIVVK